MKTPIVLLCACMLLVACGREEDPRIGRLEQQLAAAEAARDDAEDESSDLRIRVRELQDELATAEEQLNARQAEEDVPDDGEIEKLKAALADREAEIERLNDKLAQTGTQPEAESADTDNAVEADEPGADDSSEELTPAEIENRVAGLMPRLRAGDHDATRDLMATAETGTADTREELTRHMRDWVKEEPENKRARLILATILTTRFQDIDNPMEQGALAGEVKGEIEKATEIDADYYDAWHFLAILKVNYPTFALEFKEADKDLDKALELQKELPWVDRFAEIYAAYSMWHRKQGQLDNAADWVRKGLDHAPRNEGLLAEQEAVEEARTAEEE